MRRSLLAAALGSAVAQPPSPFKVLDTVSFAAPNEEISLYTGMRDLEYWEVGGTSTVHRNFVRLTGEKQGSKGWLAARQPLSAPAWSALLELRASGSGLHLYGDGEPPHTAVPRRCAPQQPSAAHRRARRPRHLDRH